MVKHRLIVGVGVTVVIMATAMGVPARRALASSSRLPVSASGCQRSEYATLDAAMRTIYDQISQDPDYTGIALLTRCGPIAIYSTSPTRYASAVAAAKLSPGMIQLHPVASSFVSMLRVQSTITAAIPRLERLGIDVRNYWPDMTTGIERMDVSSLTSSQRGQVDSMFGSSVDVQAANGPPITLTANRQSDSKPFNAGDFIYYEASTFVNDCTSGLAAHTGSGTSETYYMITAGHCSADANDNPITGTTWANGYYDGTSFHGSKAKIGTVTANSLGSQHVDGALIKVASTAKTSKYVWVGGSPGATLYGQETIQRALAGETACPDGAFEGWTCTSTIQQSGYLGCLNIPPNTLCDTINAVAPSGSPVVGAGDSGGPVLDTNQGQGVTLVGINSAEDIQGLACHAYTWRGAVCSSSSYYTDLTDILSTLGVSANLGP